MSSIGKKIDSDLPEDIEARMSKVNEVISSLERKKIDLDISIENKINQELELVKKIDIAKTELERVNEECRQKTAALDEREVRIFNKELALSEHSEKLKEREIQINKYLAIFDNMKKFIT